MNEAERIVHAFTDTGDIDENRRRTAQHAPVMQRGIIEALLDEKHDLERAVAKASRIIAGLEPGMYIPDPAQRLAAVQGVLMVEVRKGWESGNPIFSTNPDVRKGAYQ